MFPLVQNADKNLFTDNRRDTAFHECIWVLIYKQEESADFVSIL